MQENSSNDSNLLKREQAAKRCSFSTRKLAQEVKAGKIPYVRLGRLMRFIPADIDAYIEARRIG